MTVQLIIGLIVGIVLPFVAMAFLWYVRTGGLMAAIGRAKRDIDDKVVRQQHECLVKSGFSKPDWYK